MSRTRPPSVPLGELRGVLRTDVELLAHDLRKWHARRLKRFATMIERELGWIEKRTQELTFAREQVQEAVRQQARIEASEKP